LGDNPLGSKETTEEAIRQSHERTVQAGEIVFDLGDPGETLFVVEEGVVELTRPGLDSMRVVMRVQPGEFFGELSVVLGGPRTVRASALTDVSMLELDADTLELMCMKRPEIAIRMLRRLSGRVLELEDVVADMGKDKLLRPLVDLLMEQAVPRPKGQGGMQVVTTLRLLANDTHLNLRDVHQGLLELFERNLVVLLGENLLIPDLDALGTCLDQLPRSSAALD
jgi:CRP/FNR family cyclic AMP-dependent transcriptional regulator